MTIRSFPFHAAMLASELLVAGCIDRDDNVVKTTTEQTTVRPSAVVAPGTSCRHQIKDLAHRRALHPLEVVANRLTV